jgi:hypothetical protein
MAENPIVMIEENLKLKLLPHCHILFAPSPMRMDKRLRVTNFGIEFEIV